MEAKYKYECILCKATHQVNSYDNLKCQCGSRDFKLLSWTTKEQPPEILTEKEYLIKNYLMNPDLINIIDEELDKKIVQEQEARIVIFLVANMRNVENLSKGSDNLIVNAVSGTGKDHVVGAVFDLIPKDEKEELIRTTPKVLAYTRNRKKPKKKGDENE